MAERSGPGPNRRRGHQHHPRNHGDRRPPTNAMRSNNNNNNNNNRSPRESVPAVPRPSNNDDDNKVVTSVIDLTQDEDDVVVVPRAHGNVQQQQQQQQQQQTIRLEDMSKVFRPAAEGSSQSDLEDQEEDGGEMAELRKLRCTSERSELVAAREARRRNRRCADYPGLAFFGSSTFSSDTMMKFSIIRNELHNIMHTQLKRVGLMTKQYSRCSREEQ